MRESVLLAVGAVVAVVLQIVLAPNVAILGAMPNFALVYMATSAMLAKRDMVVVVAFCCGLALDLIGTYTVGVYAGLFVVAAFAAMRSAAFFGSDTLGATFVISMACSLLVEVLGGGFYASNSGISIASALLNRALPCALYDCAMVFIVLPVLSRLFASAAPSHKAPTSSTVRLR